MSRNYANDRYLTSKQFKLTIVGIITAIAGAVCMIIGLLGLLNVIDYQNSMNLFFGLGNDYIAFSMRSLQVCVFGTCVVVFAVFAIAVGRGNENVFRSFLLLIVGVACAAIYTVFGFKQSTLSICGIIILILLLLCVFFTFQVLCRRKQLDKSPAGKHSSGATSTRARNKTRGR